MVDFHSQRPGHDLRYALDGSKMEKMGWKHLLTITLFFIPASVFSKSHKYWDRDLTVLLAEGAEDCYFLPNIKATNEIDIEYQVSKNI